MSVSALRGLWNSTSESEEDGRIYIEQPQHHRRADPNLDKKKLRKITTPHLRAIDAYIEWANRFYGQVTVAHVQNYMANGPPNLPPQANEKKKKKARRRSPEEQAAATAAEEEAAQAKVCPKLPAELQCVISRSSMRYILTKHLGMEYKYTKKKGVLMNWTTSGDDCLDITDMECPRDPEPLDATALELEPLDATALEGGPGDEENYSNDSESSAEEEEVGE